MLKKLFYKVLFVSWMVFVTFSSLFSFEGMHMGTLPFTIPNLDKIVHFVFYLVMVITGFFAIKDYFVHRYKLVAILFGIVLFSIIYGMIIEVLQHVLTANRQGDLLDALANSIGAIVGMFLIRAHIYKSGSLK